MAKENKLKMLYILKRLYECSDEEHYISASQLGEYLESKDLLTNRKSIYSYVDSLIEFGFDIDKSKTGYRMMSRTFELAELKLLVDAIQSSRFIPAEKTRKIIKKLESLTSRNYAEQLNREVFVDNAVKSDNKLILINIDRIHTAINSNRQITFKYFNLTVNFSGGEKVKKQIKLTNDENEKNYNISPFALVWKNENYYLISYDEDAKAQRTFRVDKMINVEISNNKRKGMEIFDKTDIAKYSNTAFSMFNGETARVELCVHNSLAGVIFDRFGNDLSLQKKDEEHFSVMVEVQVSGMFFSWLSGFGNNIELVYPKNIRQQYREYIENILKMYK